MKRTVSDTEMTDGTRPAEENTEEERRAYVRKLLEACAPGGHFIPCITYGGSGTVFPHVDPIINDGAGAFHFLKGKVSFFHL